MIIRYDCSTDVKVMLNALLTGVRKEEKELKKNFSYVTLISLTLKNTTASCR